MCKLTNEGIVENFRIKTIKIFRFDSFFRWLLVAYQKNKQVVLYS